MMVLNVGMTVSKDADDGDDDINEHGHRQLLKLKHMTNSNIIFVLIISSNINYLKIYNNNDNVHHLKLHCSVKVYRCLGCPETSTVGTASLQIELHPHG